METLKELYTAQRAKLEKSLNEIARRIDALGKRREDIDAREALTREDYAQRLLRCEKEWNEQRLQISKDIRAAEAAFEEHSSTLKRLNAEWEQIEATAKRPTVAALEPVDFRDTGV